MDEDNSRILASPGNQLMNNDPLFEIEKKFKPKECCTSSIVRSSLSPKSSLNDILQNMESSHPQMENENDGVKKKIKHESYYSMELTINLSKAIIHISGTDEVSEEISITEEIMSSKLFPSDPSRHHHDLDSKSPNIDQLTKVTRRESKNCNEGVSSQNIQKQSEYKTPKQEDEKDDDGSGSRVSRQQYEQKHKDNDDSGNVSQISRELHEPAGQCDLEEKENWGSVSQLSCGPSQSEDYLNDDNVERNDATDADLFSKTLGTSEKEISEENPYDLYFSSEKLQAKCQEFNRTTFPLVENEPRSSTPYFGANLDLESKPVAFMNSERDGKSQSVIIGNIRLSQQSRRHRSIQSQDYDSWIGSDKVNPFDRHLDDITYSSDEDVYASDKNLIMSKFESPLPFTNEQMTSVKKYIESVVSSSLKQVQEMEQHGRKVADSRSETSSKRRFVADSGQRFEMANDPGAEQPSEPVPATENNKKRKKNIQKGIPAMQAQTQSTNIEKLRGLVPQDEHNAKKSKKGDVSKTRAGPKMPLVKSKSSPTDTKLPKIHVDTPSVHVTPIKLQKTDDIKGPTQQSRKPNALPIDDDTTNYSSRKKTPKVGETQPPIQSTSKSSQYPSKQLVKGSPNKSDADQRHHAFSEAEHTPKLNMKLKDTPQPNLKNVIPSKPASKHSTKASPNISEIAMKNNPEQMKNTLKPPLSPPKLLEKARRNYKKQVSFSEIDQPRSTPQINMKSRPISLTPYPLTPFANVQEHKKPPQFHMKQPTKLSPAMSDTEETYPLFPKVEPSKKSLQEHKNPPQFHMKQPTKLSPAMSDTEETYPLFPKVEPSKKSPRPNDKRITPYQLQPTQVIPAISKTDKRGAPIPQNEPLRNMLQQKQKHATQSQFHTKQLLQDSPAIGDAEKRYPPFPANEPLRNAFQPSQQNTISFQFQPRQFANDRPVIRSMDERHWLFSETEPLKNQVIPSSSTYSSAYLRKISDEGNYFDANRYIGLKCHCALHDGQNFEKQYLRALCYRHHREILSHRNRINYRSTEHFDGSEVEILCHKHDEEIRCEGAVECHCILQYGGENVHIALQNGINLFRLCYNHHKEIVANTPGKSLDSGYRSHEHFYGSGFEILCRQHEEHVIRLCKQYGKKLNRDVALTANQVNKWRNVHCGMDERSSDEPSYCPSGGQKPNQGCLQATNHNRLDENLKPFSMYQTEFTNTSSERE